MIESGLSFLGLGAQPPLAEWGLLITASRAQFLYHWWVVVFPGIFILLTVLSFNVIGDDLRSAKVAPAAGNSTASGLTNTPNSRADMFRVRNGVTFSGFTFQGMAGTMGTADSFGIQRPNTADGATRSGVIFALDPGTGPADTSTHITSKSPFISAVPPLPTNKFPTFCPLYSQLQTGGTSTYSYGNLKLNTVGQLGVAGQLYPFGFSSPEFAVSSGKWYMEFTNDTNGTAIGIANVGFIDYESTSNPYGAHAPTSFIYTSSGEIRTNDGNLTNQTGHSSGDVIGIALDLDNMKLYFHKNKR